MKNQVLKIKTTIQENSDDGREVGASTWYADGNAGKVITFGNFDGVTQVGVFRFRGVDIPKFAKILFARLRLKVASTDDTDFSVLLKIKGIKEADPQPFKQATRPSTRTATSNGVDWDILKKWNANEWVQTPNLKLIIDELVQQADWKPGNAMAFVIGDDGSVAGNAKTCWDSSKGKGYETELEVYYITPGLHEEISIVSLSGNDRDGEEDYDTTWFPSGYASNRISIGNDGTGSCDAGLIFSPVNIPKGAEILSARLFLTSEAQWNAMLNLLIKGFAEDNAAVFASNGSDRPSTRPKTTTQVQWTLGFGQGGVLVGEHWAAQSVYESPELKEIIQEILDRPGWAKNRLGLVIEDYDSQAGAVKNIFDSNQDGGKYGTKLVIAWTCERRVTTRDKDTKGYDKANYPEYIVVHHSATPRDNTHFATIKKSHISYGWDDIGYHKWIAGGLDGLGTLIPGRPENKIGSHNDSNKMNYRSIGICVCGSFHSTGGNEQPSTEQLATLQTLLDDIRMKRGIPKERVIGHGETPESTTDCPGDHLLAYIKNYRKTGSLT